MTYTHKAVIPLEGPPRPECGESGKCVMRIELVDCPDCLQLDADRQARITDAIQADDESEPPLMLTEEVAEAFRVDVKRPGRWARAGLLTCVHTPGGAPRYLRAEIRALLAQGHSTPPHLKRST